jgi:glyoxylase I family protein
MADFILPAKNSASPFADMRGHHVGIRTPSLAEAKDFYVGKLDFRVVAEWDYGDEKLAYLAPPTDDRFYIEVLGGGDKLPTELRPYTDLGRDGHAHPAFAFHCLDFQADNSTFLHIGAAHLRTRSYLDRRWLIPACQGDDRNSRSSGT